MSWNRKYRPNQINKLHLDKVRFELEKMLKSGKIPQVLLFAGPKGTGKTSTARIVGATLNDPANKDQVELVYIKKQSPNKPLSEPDSSTERTQKIVDGQSFVVQEMDAASNRGIDDIRALKSRIYLPPQDGNMSVYILDEAHMLTTEAFNALLKILEEPPEHVIFILATTEIHKIPSTILSRAHLIQFEKANEKELSTALEKILKAEKIDFDNDALSILAKAADGSFRDLIKMAENAVQENKLKTDYLASFNNANIQQIIQNIIDTLLAKDENKLLQIFLQLRNQNIDNNLFLKNFLEFLHQNLLQNYKVIEGKPTVISKIAQFLLNELSTINTANTPLIPHLSLELKLLELLERSKQKSGNTANSGSTSNAGTSSNNAMSGTKIKAASSPANLDVKKNETLTTKVDSSQKNLNAELILNDWSSYIDEVKKTNATISALLRSAKPVEVVSNRIVVEVFYSFHREKLLETKVKNELETIASKLCNDNIELEFMLAQSSPLTQVDLSDSPNGHKDDQFVIEATQALM